MDKRNFASKLSSRVQAIEGQDMEASLHRLNRETAFHRAVFDSLAEGILVADAEGHLVFHNESARMLLGHQGASIQGHPLAQVLRGRGLRAIQSEFEEQEEAIIQREVQFRAHEIRIYSVSVIPVIDEEEDVTYSVWIISDQSDAVRRSAERHKEENIRSLATLIAGIAHEIKNPLNGLNIHAQLVASAAKKFAETQGETPEIVRLKQSTGVLIEEIQRLTRIVEQFVHAARPPRLNPKPCYINDIIHSVADLIRPECVQRRIDLVTALEEDLPRVHIDSEQVQQAILNLAKNAMEAIDKTDGELVIRTGAVGNNLRIEIEDNGCGIAEEDRIKVFEPYHTTKFNGSGLGLMVVFRIVSAHRGEISLNSRVGVGTTFRITLPCDPPGDAQRAPTTSIEDE